MKPLTIAIRSASRCVIVTFLVAAISTVCNAAPQQLIGKSIVLHGTVTVIAEKPDGSTYPIHSTNETEIYVSTLGRVFSRRKQLLTTRIDRASKTTEHAPDEQSDQHWQLRGNDLIRSGTSNGLQFVGTISFDASFQACHYSYQYKVVGTFRDRLNGEPRRVQSVTVDSSSCTIQEGNPFAN